MSLLMFIHDDDGFSIVTDTLAATKDGGPVLFQTKCMVLPHMGLAIAGTGNGDLVDAWRHFVQTSMLALDVEMLDAHAVSGLRTVTSDLYDADGPPLTSTLYHFGFTSEGHPVRFTYRSSRGFESERSDGPGFGYKPTHFAVSSEDAPCDLEQLIDLASRLRVADDEAIPSARVGIGGELYLTTLRPNGAQQLRIHRFDDFERDWQAMNDHGRRSDLNPYT